MYYIFYYYHASWFVVKKAGYMSTCTVARVKTEHMFFSLSQAVKEPNLSIINTASQMAPAYSLPAEI